MNRLRSPYDREILRFAIPALGALAAERDAERLEREERDRPRPLALAVGLARAGGRSTERARHDDEDREGHRSEFTTAALGGS